MSDKKTDEAVFAPAKGPGVVAAAAKAAVDQGIQAAAKTTEVASVAAREAIAPAFPKAAAQLGGVATETTRAASASVEQATSTLKNTMERAMTTAEEILSIGQGNIEAFLKSGQIWTSGLQDLGRHLAQSAQAQLDGTMSAMKALASVKSVHEAIELQSTMARTALEKAVLDSGKLTDASMKLAEQTIAPLTARVNYVAERFGRTAA